MYSVPIIGLLISLGFAGYWFLERNWAWVAAFIATAILNIYALITLN